MKIKNLILSLSLLLLITSCTNENLEPVSMFGIKQTSINSIQTLPNGNTVEQENIKKRLENDNYPGSIKHLYIISAYSGDVLIYSTVKGKVTSSGKRLSPTTVIGLNDFVGIANNTFMNHNSILATNEMIQDDGTFGSSSEYIYWWDSKDIYHQQYITGGMILHISSEPVAVSKVIINLETQ